jgi:hypothetical protein
MIRLGEPVLDAVLETDPVENMRAKEPAAEAVAVLVFLDALAGTMMMKLD